MYSCPSRLQLYSRQLIILNIIHQDNNVKCKRTIIMWHLNSFSFILNFLYSIKSLICGQRRHICRRKYVILHRVNHPTNGHIVKAKLALYNIAPIVNEAGSTLPGVERCVVEDLLGLVLILSN